MTDHDDLIRRLRELAKSNDLVVCSGRELIVLLDALEAANLNERRYREALKRVVTHALDDHDGMTYQELADMAAAALLDDTNHKGAGT